MTQILTCFLTVNPCELFYNFVKQLPDLSNVYICIDDNEYNIPNYQNEIKIIKYQNDICENEGFKDTHSAIKGATSREKALYYFYKNYDINYDYIWFIEEDVFIPNINTIQNINNKYESGDLLSAKNDKSYKYNMKRWHWKLVTKQLKDKFELPYVSSMICAIRCSKKLLNCIFDFANKHKTLFFCETMFNTIAYHNNLKTNTIKELEGIVWRKQGPRGGGWKKEHIKEHCLYHPIKSIEKQYEYRENI